LFLCQNEVYIQQGQTIFALGNSIYQTIPNLRDSFFEKIDKNPNLTLAQKETIKRNALLPEIKATWTYICPKTAPRLYWPFYKPASYPANFDLQELGEKTLARVAAKVLRQQDDLCKSISDLTVVGQSSLSVVDSSTHAASIFSLANGMLSIKVCIGVLP
jgi:hypothetical protein